MNTTPLTRRTFVSASAGVLAGLAQAQPQTQPPQRNQKAPPAGEPHEPQSPLVGQPASDTDAAQGAEVPIPPPRNRPVGFAIVGLGKLAIGEVLPAFSQTRRCRPVALVSGHPEKAKAVAQAFGIDPRSTYNYDNFDSIKDNPDIDVVYVIVPNALHPEFTIRAAQAGKHVLCEKPLATRVEDCQKMIDACAKAGRKLMTAYRVHYEPFNRTLRDWCKDRKYGDLRYIVADTNLDVGGPNQWRVDPKLGGGSMFDIGIYALNAARYLVGEEPTHIAAQWFADRGQERFRTILESSIAFQLRFPGGVIANCTSSFETARVNRYTAICAKGWMGLEPATEYRGLRLFHGKDKERTEQKMDEVNHFAAEMDHMAECVLEDRTPDTPGEEGLKDVRLILAAYEAAKGNKVIEL